MRRARALALGCGAVVLLAAGSTFEVWRQPDGDGVVGTVIYCATGKPREAAPCGLMANPIPVLGLPFQRSGDPFLLPATTTPKQYQVAQPDGAKSYRGVNPCTVDIRIRTVTSMTEAVTPTTGTRFLARTAETLGSIPPALSPRIVSIMI